MDLSPPLPDPARPLGATPLPDGGTAFAVWAPEIERVEVILKDGGGERVLPLQREPDGVHRSAVADAFPGDRYRLRAGGHLLVDPYALAIDRPYGAGEVVPWAIVPGDVPVVSHRTPAFRPGGLIYELPVRAFTMLHPEVPEEDRGTLRALAHPAVIGHLQTLCVDAVELMPVVAWMDERHLPPLGLHNAWGYNPVTFMPVEPRLGTLADLRAAVAALHDAGIDVFLDLVFNHTGESDRLGRTLSFRGLAEGAYYRYAADGSLINDTGCGNTVACDHPVMERMILDTLRHFVRHAGVDGFRFDLAPILGRTAQGFDPDSPLLHALATDPLLADRIWIAEPWDIGPGGYQLGNFPLHFLEWNDRYRDDMRRFWRGDGGTVGALATRLAGSSDIFAHHGATTTRSINFLAAHDGFTLADLVAHEQRHNLANGEDNRDGHGENHSWNNGVEGATDDPAILAARRGDVKALLATLFASRGTIMLTAGDEFGRSQRGNNNAYCQDNAIGWIEWTRRDPEVQAHAFALAALRRACPELTDPAFLADGEVDWLTEAGTPMQVGDWEDAGRGMLQLRIGALLVRINRTHAPVAFTAPPGDWDGAGDGFVPARSVTVSRRRGTVDA